MRVWSIHPKYLDVKGLVAGWREGLLAQKCLAGLTKGYTNHPQLDRFKASANPLVTIGTYLHQLVLEAQKRQYNFDGSKVLHTSPDISLTVTQGQLDYEWQHFLKKIAVRDPERHHHLKTVSTPDPHPLFTVIPGDIEAWEVL